MITIADLGNSEDLRRFACYQAGRVIGFWEDCPQVVRDYINGNLALRREALNAIMMANARAEMQGRPVKTQLAHAAADSAAFENSIEAALGASAAVDAITHILGSSHLSAALSAWTKK